MKRIRIARYRPMLYLARCMPVWHRSSFIETAEWIDGTSAYKCIHCAVSELEYLQNKAISLYNIVQDFELSWFLCFFFATARQPSQALST